MLKIFNLLAGKIFNIHYSVIPKRTMSDYFIHPNAICESSLIGSKTRIWAFAHILPGAKIGEECNICDHVFIENNVTVGDRVTLKCGVQLWDGIEIGDDVFIGPNVTFTNDKFPRSRKYPDVFLRTEIRKGASVGANSTILPGIVIGEQAMVGAGSVVTHSVPAAAIVLGNPAKIVGYIQDDLSEVEKVGVETISSIDSNNVKGVAIHKLKHVHDLRGDLVAGEFEREVPFRVKRFFMIHGVGSREVRGEHAHRLCHQFLICIKGSVSITADDGVNSMEIILDDPGTGIHIPPLIWSKQYHYSPDALLLVFASEYYEQGDYIRDYKEFSKIVHIFS